MLFTIRLAEIRDADAVRTIFVESYGATYPYIEYYDVNALTRIIANSDNIMLVAEDEATGRVVGTASVLLQAGAFGDLCAEFARLAVLPDMREHGIGGMLMRERLRRVGERIHVGIVDARTVHRHSVGLAQRNGFAPVGFCPLKDLFQERESTSIHAQWFGDALTLRRNNPRVIPEVHRLASLAMESAKIGNDIVVDDTASPYPHASDFEIEECTSEGYLSLLRIERGRVRQREVFGPMGLQSGFFRIRAAHAHYLVARAGSRVAGAIGYIRDDYEHVVRIFELITPDDEAVHILLSELERRCREEWNIAYLEIDIGADAPRMQRSALEIGFVPSAYVPAMVFRDVERLDVVRMVRLTVPCRVEPTELKGHARAIAELVLESISEQETLPALRAAGEASVLFQGLSSEQVARLSAICTPEHFDPGGTIIEAGVEGDALYLILEGDAEIFVASGEPPVGATRRGEVLGEMGLLASVQHTATAVARSPVSAIRLPYDSMRRLVRRRPDIGVVIYRNLAGGLGEKLVRADRRASV